MAAFVYAPRQMIVPYGTVRATYVHATIVRRRADALAPRSTHTSARLRLDLRTFVSSRPRSRRLVSSLCLRRLSCDLNLGVEED